MGAIRRRVLWKGEGGGLWKERESSWGGVVCVVGVERKVGEAGRQGVKHTTASTPSLL